MFGIFVLDRHIAMTILVPIPDRGKQLCLPNKLTQPFGGRRGMGRARGRGRCEVLSLGYLISCFYLPAARLSGQQFPERTHRLFFLHRYHLLKLLQKFGTVKQFDFLFHKSGALEGQPRGYCFVNFETKQVIELPLPQSFTLQSICASPLTIKPRIAVLCGQEPGLTDPRVPCSEP